MSSKLTKVIIFSTLAAALYAQPQVLTWHNDNARTGQNLQETILTPTNVNSTTFGKLFTLPTDGKVDAQPLYVPSLAIPSAGTHNVVYVMSEHDTAYAFDADTGALLWQKSLLGANETTSDTRGCGQVTPEIGITATPAIDLQAGPHGTIYIIAMSKDSTSHYHHRLHALDLTTGVEQFSGPVEIQATYPGTGVEGNGTTLTFDPKQHKERAGLVILNGTVFTAWSSHCDISPYTGWVIGYNETTLARTTVLNLTPNGGFGGIWASGSGTAADAAGNLYLLMGNGTFETTLDPSGFPNKSDYGNAVVKMSSGGSTLAVADYFTMQNTVSESNADQDLGSGGIMVMPPVNDSQGQPRSLAVGAGKDGNIYVVDRNNMGKFSSSSNNVYQELVGAVGGGGFSSPSWFNGTLYFGASGSTLRAFTFANGVFSSTPSSHTSLTFGFPGTTPSISANGTQNGIVWAAENSNPATLHAYDAANLAHELYNSNQAANSRDTFGPGNKFIVPTVVNGKVYVGTTTGVGVFGLISGSQTPDLTITNTHSGNFTQGQTGATYTITVTNSGAGPTSGTVTVTDSVPSGLTATSINGTGWSCTQPSGPCTRTDALAASGAYPAITLTVNVAANAPANVTNSATVAGGGESNTANDTATSPTTITQLTSQGLQLIPVPPCRLMDTRANSGFSGSFGAPSLTAGSPREIPIPSGSCNIPPSAKAYSLNITVVPKSQTLTFLTVWPSGQPQPFVSTLNSWDASVLANAAIVPAGAGGSVSVYSTDNTDLVVDIDAYFAAPVTGSLQFYPLPPCRIADTRNAAGTFGGPSIAGTTSRTFPVTASPCNVPPSAQAYSLNATVVPHGPLGYLTAWPTGQSQPLVSTLNAMDGSVLANAAIVPAGNSGSVSFYASNDTDLVLDINGYFAPPGAGGLNFYTVTPCRIADTRNATGPFGGPILGNGETRSFPVPQSACGLPSTAGAYSLNVTVVPTGGLNFLSIWPVGPAWPGVSTLNDFKGLAVANAAFVPAGTGGAVNVLVMANPASHVILDTNGYFAQ